MPQGCLAIASLLECVEAVITLDLSCNNLSYVGAVCLSRGLKYCVNLKNLYISNAYNIGEVGVEAISTTLRCCAITELSLACGHIKDNGAEALARCLQTCNKLTLLNLNDNEIGDRGASNLGIALKHCSRLRNLSLNSNLISGLGVIHLAEEIQHCQNLETLELGYNFIWCSRHSKYSFYLKESTKLERVFVPIDAYLPNCKFIAFIDMMMMMELVLN